MDYYKILLLGGSGKGKTYSFENLAQEGNKTAYINVEQKPLPFKGKFKADAKPSTSERVLDLMQKASVNPEIDCIIVDSFSAYSDLLMKESREAKKGWDIMNHFNENIANFHATLKRIEKEVFVTAHYEIIGDELTGVRERRAKIKGKEHEGLVEKEYTIVLYTDAVPVPGGRPRNFFTLVSDGTTSAKCPPGIFGMETLEIPNDSKIVFDKIKAFRS